MQLLRMDVAIECGIDAAEVQLAIWLRGYHLLTKNLWCLHESDESLGVTNGTVHYRRLEGGFDILHQRDRYLAGLYICCCSMYVNGSWVCLWTLIK